ncbi:MAG TPA: hypothetical protein VF400_09225, partial [Anaeromyxobacteraceae bacterium]
HLEGLGNLEALHLAHTDITDAGLVHLRRLARLRKINLSGTRVTDAGVAALARALPGIQVVRQVGPL